MAVFSRQTWRKRITITNTYLQLVKSTHNFKCVCTTILRRLISDAHSIRTFWCLGFVYSQTCLKHTTMSKMFSRTKKLRWEKNGAERSRGSDLLQPSTATARARVLLAIDCYLRTLPRFLQPFLIPDIRALRVAQPVYRCYLSPTFSRITIVIIIIINVRR